MAAPHVTGIIAQLFEAYWLRPRRPSSSVPTSSATARPTRRTRRGVPSFDKGHGLVDVITAHTAGKLTAGAGGRVTAPGASYRLTAVAHGWTRDGYGRGESVTDRPGGTYVHQPQHRRPQPSRPRTGRLVRWLADGGGRPQRRCCASRECARAASVGR
ncbi:MAG: hypothetical protein ACR2GM_03220 [Nocardioidaceae bacterium]